MAKGFTHTYEYDSLETFAPVAKLNTMRNIFSLVVNIYFDLFQLDVKNVFLNGDLQEVFMGILPSFSNNTNKHMICD